ncbi:DNA ligase [Proteus phage vB_PmiP_Pm5460]|uniref:DNA ligase n=1 Tax=Proteus phage vB_PmiP_Pm5460 TaxID=1636249 RepID=A0A0G2SSH2_9CAUD|nr:DNA ligase [Proteus phage vB_PmiP_Pm5460]AKA61837.1 DNA ligase [Proteus phage vB_PmiP_Pm5460]
MNIFEFLGLPEDHRAKPVMLVKHREEVPASKLTFPVFAQVKRDGIFSATVVRDGEVGIFGRTGLKLANVEHLEEQFKSFPAGVYLGELQTLCLAHLEELSGVVNPNRKLELDFHGQQIKDELYIDFFDMLTIKAFIEGETDTGFLKRHEALTRRIGEIIKTQKSNILPYTTCWGEEEVESFAQEQIDAGREGAVFKLDCDYEAGHKGWRQTKIVRSVTYDLLCIGYEEGKGKYKGKVANLVFQWHKGKTVKAMLGKGWTHDDAEFMFKCIQEGGELQPIGKIFTVKALQDSSKGNLRLPKVGELRHDKELPDV